MVAVNEPSLSIVVDNSNQPISLPHFDSKQTDTVVPLTEFFVRFDSIFLLVFFRKHNFCDNHVRRHLIMECSIKVDFISQLKCFPHLLEKVFHQLKPVDLRSAYCVSQSWREAILACSRINRIRLRSIRKLKRLKKQVGSVRFFLFFFSNFASIFTGKLAVERGRR